MPSKSRLWLVLVSIVLVGCGRSRDRSDGLPPGATPIASAGPRAAVNPGDAALAPPAVEAKDRPDRSPSVRLAPVSFAPIAKHADPSVVTITTEGEDDGRSRRRATSKGLGTGFIVEKDGVIVTNNHVIEAADKVVVKLSDDRSFPAKVAGRDPRTDIAVIKIDAKNLVPLALGNSDQMEVGDWVVAIGNPFGLSHTVSAGIVSGKGRGRDEVPLDPTGYYNFIQTDASINPGNSGGPLLDLQGEVVGMNTAIRGGGAQGIGFAIPINMVKQLLPTLLRDGKVTRSALGVRIRDVRDLAPEDRRKLHLTEEKGAVIESLEPGGAADKAKLESQDVIVAFDGQPIERGSLLQWLASTAGVGKRVTLRIVRAGRAFELPVTLGELQETKPTRRLRPAPPPTEEDDDAP